MTQDQIKEIQQISESETQINSLVEDTFTVTIPVPVGLASPVPVAVHDPTLVLRRGSLVSAFLSGRSERTNSAYRQDLEDFRAFVKADTLEEAACVLLLHGHGEANGLALAYKARSFPLRKNLPHPLHHPVCASKLLERLTCIFPQNCVSSHLWLLSFGFAFPWIISGWSHPFKFN